MTSRGHLLQERGGKWVGPAPGFRGVGLYELPLFGKALSVAISPLCPAAGGHGSDCWLVSMATADEPASIG